MKRRSLFSLIFAPLIGCIHWGRQPALDPPAKPKIDERKVAKSFKVKNASISYTDANGWYVKRLLTPKELAAWNESAEWPTP